MFWPFSRSSRKRKIGPWLSLREPDARPRVERRAPGRRKLEFQNLESRDLFAIAPLGNEFQINTTTQFDQGYKPNGNLGGLPRTIDMADDGSFVAVWNDRDFGVAAQRFSAQGVPQGTQFGVPTSTTLFMRNTAVAMDADGDFVVVWQKDLTSNELAIFAQRFSKTGARVGGEIIVSSTIVSDEAHPSVAIDADGDFVVVWDKSAPDGDREGVYAQRFSSTGVKQGGEFRVNSYTTGAQNYAHVAMDANGNFVVVWQSQGQDGGQNGIYGQRYSSSGTAVGSEFRVNFGTTSDQNYPVVAMDQDGDFVVVWEGWGDQQVVQDQWIGIYARRFNSSGAAVGGDIHVNTYTTYYQRYPSVAIDSDGDFVVAWEGEEGTSASDGIFAQAFSSTGVPQGSEIHVNSYTSGEQDTPAVAMDAAGNFVVMWTSFAQDGSGDGVYGQRFSGANAPTAGLSISDVTVTEGNTGTTNAVFTVTLTPAAAQTVTVNYSTSDISAQQPGDYTSRTGALTFPPGTTSRTITVPIVGDVLVESSETFQVNLSGAVNSGIGDGIGIGTITDDDSGPVIAIQDVSVTEGNTGTVIAVFRVNLSSAYPQPVTVAYGTANGTATTGSDFTGKSGTLTFVAGSTAEEISVQVTGDSQYELDETFQINLSNPVNASIGDASATGMILNDDPLPGISISNTSLVEGSAFTKYAVVDVTLSNTSWQTVTVTAYTANATATAPTDYTATTGTLTFAPGVTSLPFTVAVNSDTTPEPDEDFMVLLSFALNSNIVDSVGIVTILSDDGPPPTISINDIDLAEGNTGSVNAVFTVALSSTYHQPVTVAFQTNDASAFALDYNATSGTLTFAPGTTSRTITVAVLGDLVSEGDEAFTVSLSSPANATIADNLGIATIVDNDQSWYNAAKPSDVDSSGTTSGIDLVYVVEALNTYGGGSIAAFTPAPTKKIDVNNDTFLSGFDLILIVDALNSGLSLQLAAPLSAASDEPPPDDYSLGFSLAATHGESSSIAATNPSSANSTPTAAVLPASQSEAPTPVAAHFLPVSSARGKNMPRVLPSLAEDPQS